MGTIAIMLDPSRLENPDLDLRYEIPDRIAALTHEAIQDNGYDYRSDARSSMIIFLRSEQPKDDASMVLAILRNEDFLGNNLFDTCVVGVDSGAGYKVIHPHNYVGDFLDTSK